MSDEQRKNLRDDALNLLVAGGVALFSILIGGSLLVGLAGEPEKAETFLVLLGSGSVLAGLGCGGYCYYILTKRVSGWLYPVSLGLTVMGLALAVIAEAMYETLG